MANPRGPRRAAVRQRIRRPDLRGSWLLKSTVRTPNDRQGLIQSERCVGHALKVPVARPGRNYGVQHVPVPRHSIGMAPTTKPLPPDDAAADFLADDHDAALAGDRLAFEGTPVDPADPDWKMTPEQLDALLG